MLEEPTRPHAAGAAGRTRAAGFECVAGLTHLEVAAKKARMSHGSRCGPLQYSRSSVFSAASSLKSVRSRALETSPALSEETAIVQEMSAQY